MASSDSLNHLLQKKAKREKIAMITAYDFASADVLHEVGVDIILVGDSLGFTTLGYDSMTQVTMEDMIHHLKAVVRGAQDSFILCDMPVNSYATPEDAVRNGRLLKENGCSAVKIEGPVVKAASALVNAGIPVMGHIGFTPQTLTKYKVQGRSAEEEARIRSEALSLEQAGCFAMLLELVAAPLSKTLTETLKIPTIGIGSGVDCDGQVLVFNDLLGIFEKFKPKFVRRYKELRREMLDGCSCFISDVKSGAYPSEKELY